MEMDILKKKKKKKENSVRSRIDIYIFHGLIIRPIFKQRFRQYW